MSCSVRSTALCKFGAIQTLMSGYSAVHLTRYITRQMKPLESIVSNATPSGLVSALHGIRRMGSAPFAVQALSQTPVTSLARLPLTSLLCDCISIISGHILLCRFHIISSDSLVFIVERVFVRQRLRRSDVSGKIYSAHAKTW